MSVNWTNDLRAVFLGLGLALLLYYGLAVSCVMGGDASLNRPLTWMGLMAGVSAVLAALPDGKKETTSHV